MTWSYLTCQSFVSNQCGNSSQKEKTPMTGNIQNLGPVGFKVGDMIGKIKYPKQFFRFS